VIKGCCNEHNFQGCSSSSEEFMFKALVSPLNKSIKSVKTCFFKRLEENMKVHMPTMNERNMDLSLQSEP
jgi:hypothetical protein